MNLITRRVVANLVDILVFSLLTPLFAIIPMALILILRPFLEDSELISRIILPILFIPCAIGYIYINYRQIKNGQTFGYKLLRIRIVYLEEDSKRSLAIKRLVLKSILYPLLLVPYFAIIYGKVLYDNEGSMDILDNWLGTHVEIIGNKS